MHRLYTLSLQPNYYQGSQSMAMYGASGTAGAPPGSGQTVDEYGNVVVTKNIYITQTTRTVNGRVSIF